MAKQPNLKLIGLFLVIGTLSFVLILGVLLKNKLFANRGGEAVMYFEESINGLSVGSPVVLKGVKIGEVSKIDLMANPETLDFSIPVYARMQTRTIEGTGHATSGSEVLEELVQRGLRARLVAQSYVTGQLMIELEMLPDSEVKYHEGAKAVEIPTALSPIGELSRGLQRIPLAEGVTNFTEFFKGLNQSMPEINKIMKDVATAVARNKGATGEVLDNLNKAAVNVGKAAKSMQNLADYLEQHPEALIKGKK
jgi:paraquat-inducible protein B